MYRIEVSPAADRDVEKLKGRMTGREFVRLRDAVRKLAGEPRPHGVRKIKGLDKAYRIRLGDYRVVFEIYDNVKMVLIIQISRRTETTYQQ